MESKELRIGNYVLYFRDSAFPEVHKIKHIHPNGIIIKIGDAEKLIFWNEIKPIPLTEEWLLKFGFDESRCKFIGVDTSFETIQLLGDGSVLVYDSNDDFVCLKSIKNVHQLQNLYFALTGEELILKQ